MPEMISIGCPSASRARSTKDCLRLRAPQGVGADHAHAVGRACRAVAGRSARGMPARAPPRPCRAGPSASSPGAEADHFAQAIEDDELAVRVARDDHVETVGTEIDRGKYVRDGLRSAARHVNELASGGERGAAAASGLRVRIADHELRAVEAFAIVDFRAGEVLHAHRIDEQLDAQVLDAGVAILLVSRRTRSRIACPSSRRPARKRAA